MTCQSDKLSGVYWTYYLGILSGISSDSAWPYWGEGSKKSINKDQKNTTSGGSRLRTTRRRRRSRRRRRTATDIKSSNPHLTGGELRISLYCLFRLSPPSCWTCSSVSTSGWTAWGTAESHTHTHYWHILTCTININVCAYTAYTLCCEA